MDRSKDWLRQAERDLDQARWNLRGEFYELACFLSQQAAEKALKPVYEARKLQGWGHAVSRLLSDLPDAASVPADLRRAARRLDRHYIPARYPNGFTTGVPADYYGARDAEEAIAHAEQIIAFCKQHLPG